MCIKPFILLLLSVFFYRKINYADYREKDSRRCYKINAGSLRYRDFGDAGHRRESGDHAVTVAVCRLCKRLLIVEDNPINSEIAGEILRRDGYEVECAENGLLASKMVAAAEPHYYDAILMDIMMPVMDGYEATKVIRAMDAERAKVPIIAITANTFDTDRQAAFDAGMNAHVSKPFEPAQLLEVVSKFTS